MNREPHGLRDKWDDNGEQFRAVFEHAACGICLIGTDGRFLQANLSLCSMLGYTVDELSSLHIGEITHPEDAELSRDWAQAMLAGESCPHQLEKRCLHRSGRIVWVTASRSLHRDQTGVPLFFIEIMQDITEQKSLENMLRYGQKMEAIGTLTGGIAHDYNNILSAIVGYGTLLEMKLPRDNPLFRYVEQILSAANRAARLNQTLLAFGRTSDMHLSVVDLDEVVLGTVSQLIKVLGKDIGIRTSLSAGDATVLADPDQIEQVLLNLAVNARDSMPEGGMLTLGTMMTALDAAFVRANGYGEPGAYLLLTVSDTGTGMDEKTRQRIFEPFFSTKGAGKGTGLGLSMVYGIIKSHKGFITCHSDPGNGTTFSIHLPAQSQRCK
ncbi:two-component system sensor histidine kinase NtrB [Geomobilimonas luticola]|uniref:histidine kinase n=1 Tax=Geomobilimonas luticola TaxID=1114878 RepID=A0ABS5SGV2_9BACT|nr:PAS domain S-box protein [Geomobilimonas luticola]MBT0654595.1 PAS domain S-box protein [Geomobilimonas luticola]